FLQDILLKVKQTRFEMLASVSQKTLLLYWEIGKAVSEKLNNGGWGKSVVEKLSNDLRTELPGIRGFSARNIWNMKRFYEFYANLEFKHLTIGLNSATTVAELEAEVDICSLIAENQIEVNSATTVAVYQKYLSDLITNVGWVQNCIVLEKCKTLKQIVFYLKQTKDKGWSKLDLLEKIEQNYFENFALAQNNFVTSVPESLKAQIAYEFLDDYNIELLNPDQPISEKALENAIVTNIIKFLNEMGGTFAFVGQQFRLVLDEKEYFVDLLFFNLTLNCYVVFELKAREFSPKDIGQTQMYMQLINKQVKQPYHNNTIGIVLCRTKNRLEVEYMLELTKDPMGVATYNRYDKLPEEYAKYLPSELELDKRLIDIFTPYGDDDR
ncbi:MAG: PDDEXK nuclease domain-containing protein, partial [Candidatus Cloacimonetes bacterium]|nr:PDDEXK nuclease domain-containing protein [Candidatus Cloacimonadota bacterium]